MSKLYGIASQAYSPGHGDSYYYEVIAPLDAYHSGPFPPVFTRWGDAQLWIESQPYRTGLKVVELHLND
jgi:hypothetical protein